MLKNISGLFIKSKLLIIFLLFPDVILSQPQTGKVLSSETNLGVAYVNIGVIGKNIGTVSDNSGNFTLALDKIFDKDSLKFSMIGYESQTFLVSQFRDDPVKNVYLTPRSYDLPEINIEYHRPRKVTLGNPVETNDLRSGFSNNDLGSELGIKMNTRKKVLLKNINLDVAICTYDSVTYRINIYLIENKIVCNNILTEPIYISFTKEKISDVLSFDLSEYSIMFEGEVLVTLELYKDLGEGRLLFRTEYFTGLTYHRKTSQGTWTQSPGVIGMSLDCIVKE
jgi:hypothetical protein